MGCSERFAHNHHSRIMRVLHILILLARQEFKLMRLLHDFLFVARVCTMDDLQVIVKELIIEVTTGSKVNQIEYLLLRVVEIVCWVRICLHYFPLEELSEAKFKHKWTNPIAFLLTCLYKSVDLNAINKLRAQNFFVGQVGNYFGRVVLFRTDGALVVILHLHFGFSSVIAFPVQLPSGHLNQLI